MEDIEYDPTAMRGPIRWAKEWGRCDRSRFLVAEPRELCDRLASAVPHDYELSGEALFTLLRAGIKAPDIHRHNQLVCVSGSHGWASAEFDACPTANGPRSRRARRRRRRVHRVELVWGPRATGRETVRRATGLLHRRVTAALRPTIAADPDHIRSYLEWVLDAFPRAELRKIVLRFGHVDVLVILDHRRRRRNPSKEGRRDG